MNHGFLQGNKRTAYATLEWFLAINRLGGIAAADDDVVRCCSEAENYQWSVNDIEDWL
jgi:prophage maintenance system killer protein